MDLNDTTLGALRLRRLLSLAITEPSAHRPTDFDCRGHWVRQLAPACGGDEKAAALIASVADPELPLPVLQSINDKMAALKARAHSPPELEAVALAGRAVRAALVAWHDQPADPDSAEADVYEDLAVFLAGDAVGELFQIAANRLRGAPGCDAAAPGPGGPR